MNLLLAPHNDDETLFAAFTVMREKPLVAVVTDCYVQFGRNPSVSWAQRRRETQDACAILGVPVYFMALEDDSLSDSGIAYALTRFKNFDMVWIPMLQGGHLQHDQVHRAAMATFTQTEIRTYGTYSRTQPHFATDGIPVVPTAHEMSLKRAALECYKSQHVWSREHFTAAKAGLEYVQ